MAQQWRIESERALDHVLSRGNDRRNLMLGDENQHLVLETLGRMSDRFDTEIFTYVLIPNQYHVLLRSYNATPSGALQWFGESGEEQRRIVIC